MILSRLLTNPPEDCCFTKAYNWIEACEDYGLILFSFHQDDLLHLLDEAFVCSSPTRDSHLAGSLLVLFFCNLNYLCGFSKVPFCVVFGVKSIFFFLVLTLLFLMETSSIPQAYHSSLHFDFLNVKNQLCHSWSQYYKPQYYNPSTWETEAE